MNLSSGDLSLSLPLVALPGRNGLGVAVGIRYSSAARSAATWNLEAPTGSVGLGWDLPDDRIVRDTHGTGTVLDDRYYLVTEGSTYPLVYCGSDTDGDTYLTEHFVFWKIRYRHELEMWVVIKEDGVRWLFGGNDKTPGAHGASIEIAVTRGNWIGSSVAGGQQVLPTAWHLSCIQDPEGNQIVYEYEQELDYVGAPADASNCQYTVACRTRQITGANGERIVFKYAQKAPDEYQRRNGVPPANAPHAYQDRADTRYLASIDVLDEQGAVLSTVSLRYALLGSGSLTKRILKGVTRFIPGGAPLGPEELFTYYGESTNDKLTVSVSDTSRVFNAASGALWGALASHVTPQGASFHYTYASQTVDNATRDLAIARPQNDSPDWHHPRTYFGPDFAVVLWTGKAATARSGNLFVTAYHWQGRWIAADLGTLPGGDDTRVDVSTDFFAVLTPGQATALHLYAKQPVNPGTWVASAPPLTAGPHIIGAAADDFYALMDADSGQLYRFTLDGTSWRTDTDTPVARAGVVRGMAAQGAVLFTSCALPDNSVQPDLCLYHLDHAKDWRSVVWSVPPFCPNKSASSSIAYQQADTGIDQLDVQLTSHFAVVQSRHTTQTTATGIYAHHSGYRHFVYRWGEDYSIVETRELGAELSTSEGSAYAPRVTALGSQVMIDMPGDLLVQGNKSVYMFTGSKWISTSYPHDSLRNNYIGTESFTVTHDGRAQFYEFDPIAETWQPKIDPFPDGNPTLWERWWPVIYLVEGILTLPLGPEWLALDVLFLEIDLVMAQLVDAGGAGKGASRFFTGDCSVWHRDVNATWTKLGDLVTTYTGKSLGSVPNGERKEDLTLSQQNTQHASDFIVFTTTLSRYTIYVFGGQASRVDDSGFPADTSRILLLHDGAFRGESRPLPDGQLVRSSGAPEETSLVGSNAFIAYRGGTTLKDATALTLYRVIDDDFAGPMSTYVVAAERVNDGEHDTWTHFAYADGEMHPSGATALFGKVTQWFSGASLERNPSNGLVESLFHTGLPGTYPNVPSGAGNATSYPGLVQGLLYHSRVVDGDGSEVASMTQAWQVTEAVLAGNRKGHWVRPVRTVSVVGSQTRQVDHVFDPSGMGFVTQEMFTNITFGSHAENIVKTYRYACQQYPELMALNIVNQVAQTSVTVNGVLTDSVATSWQSWADASPTGTGVSASAWPTVPRSLWGPVATYRALSAHAGTFDPQHIDPKLWQVTSRVVVRDGTTGIVTESQDLDGVTTSTVFDSSFRFPVASFTHASVSKGEAGYHGFEGYEDAGRWHFSGGALQPFGHTGRSSYSGTTARVAPATFSPRASVPYVVSAWVQPRLGGAGGTVGFGNSSSPIPPETAGSAPMWQYVEYVDPSPSSERVPFVSCDGALDDVRFGPVDAVFEAAAYDPSHLVVLSTMGTNGEVCRFVRDHLQRVVAEIGPGEELSGIRSWTLAREAAPIYDPKTPNTKLSFIALGGGRYVESLRLPALNAPLEVFGPDWRFPDEADPALELTRFGWCLRFTVDFHDLESPRSRGPTVLRVTWGTATLDLSEGWYELRGQAAGSGYSVAKTKAPNARGSGPVDVTIAAIGRTLLVFQEGTLVLCRNVPGGTGAPALSLTGDPMKGGLLTDVYLLRDPCVAAAHSDGFGRELQSVCLDGDATGVVVTGTLHDGWGRAAVQTMPIRLTPVSFARQIELVESYDWQKGLLTGLVERFYRGEGSVPSQQAMDPQYAATRTPAESSPLARAAETAPPGAAYRPGAGTTTTWNYSAMNEDALHAYRDLGLELGAFGYTTAYLPVASAADRIPQVQVFDRQGNVVAVRTGAGYTPLTVAHLSDRGEDGTLRLTTLQANHFQGHWAEGSYAKVTTTDFLGRVVALHDPDAGLQQMIYDPAGRLRFLVDACGASLNPNRVIYWKYDLRGRMIEEGWILTAWDRESLQNLADTQPSWPTTAAFSDGTNPTPRGQWTGRWTWDTTPGGADSRQLKGRLAQVATKDETGAQVIESFEYDDYGRTTAVALVVEGSHVNPRTTRYGYTFTGRVAQIVYPAPDGTATGSTVRYSYDTLGRPCAVGTADRPALYAAYDYTFDGRVASEWLADRSIHGEVTHDFQGRRLSVDYQAGGKTVFAEDLAFSDTSGGDPTGVTVRGTSMPAPYRYQYRYDALGRLAGAQTVADTALGIAPHPEWDVIGQNGSIGYDPNGNITSLGTGAAVHQYAYAPGTNELESRAAGDGQEHYGWDFNGRLASSPAVASAAYDPVTSLLTALQVGGETTVVRYTGTRRRALKGPAGAADHSKLYVHGAGADPLLEERDGTRTQYVYGPAGLVAAVVGDKVYTVLRDSLGSTRVLVPPDAPTSQLLCFNYLPFGDLMQGNAAAPQAAPIPYLFTGRELEPETGLYDLRARLYDPSTGRFVSPDPAGEFASPYVYVGNHPVSRVDPSGMLSLTVYRIGYGALYAVALGALGAGIGAAVGAGVDSTDRGRGALVGAGVGLGIGAGLALIRVIAEFGVVPLYREVSGRLAAARGESFPVVVFNAHQQTRGYNSGRLGAEMIAEEQRIPRSLWNDHLVSFQDLDAGRVRAPATFNRRIIAVAHGYEHERSVEVAVASRYKVNADQFIELFSRGGAQPFEFAPGGVDRLDLCVCYPRRTGFTRDLRTTLNNKGWSTTGWASSENTTPVGWGLGSGVIRDDAGEVREWLYGLLPFRRPGVMMPSHSPGPGPVLGGWGAF